MHCQIQEFESLNSDWDTNPKRQRGGRVNIIPLADASG